jgi:hypothetical protein
MTADEPEDVLNAVSAAFGLRWLADTGAEGSVRLVDKDEYRSQPAGLRHAMSDALPADVRWAVRHGGSAGLRRVEAGLKSLTPGQLQRLEAATMEGPLPLAKLDPDLARPLGAYLKTFSVYRLGRVADQYYTEARDHAGTPVRYGANEGGSKQFTFRLRSGWLAVAPE